ncbi:MAG: O-antigen ligase family protein [Tissierellia bacterium]|nr:O-antigen ligase family protein [Tissierellia bacterium]
MHYIIAPFLSVISFIIIYIYKDKTFSRLLKPLLGLAVLTLISSVNYIYFTNPNQTYLQYISYASSIYLTAFAFFFFTLKRPHSLYAILLLFIIYFILAVYRYFRTEYLNELGVFDFYQNNAFYYVLMPLPILLLSKNNLLRIIVLTVSIVICILSLKRSAIIVVSAITLVYIWINILNSKNGFIKLIGLIFTFSIIIYFSDLTLLIERYDRLILRLDKLADDGGSGRLDIINRFFAVDFQDMKNVSRLVIGNGFNATNNKYPDLASLHNDWLEIFYSFGIFGLLLLFAFFNSLFKIIIKELKSKSYLATAYISAGIIFLFYSLFGGNFYFLYYSLPLFSFIGIAEAMRLNNIKQI